MSKDMHAHNCGNNDCVNFNQSAKVGSCENEPAVITPVTGERIIRVPVNLGEFVVSTNLSANIHFNDPVLEIKEVKKQVEIVQCRLLTPTSTNGPVTGTFPLYIKGFIRKNFQYATPDSASLDDCVTSDMRSLTTRVPFECTTLVTLTVPIQLPVASDTNEWDFARTKPLGSGYPEKDHYHSSDISQFHQESTSFYNDLPFCELVSHSIIGWEEATDRVADSPVGEGVFHNIVEKTQLSFRVRILQVQNLLVNDDDIAGIGPGPSKPC